MWKLFITDGSNIYNKVRLQVTNHKYYHFRKSQGQFLHNLYYYIKYLSLSSDTFFFVLKRVQLHINRCKLLTIL